MSVSSRSCCAALIIMAAGGIVLPSTGCFSGGSACREGERKCLGTCSALQSDPDNCGGCGNACSAEQVCSLGQCSTECPPGLQRCGRSCVEITSDPRHCGGCDQTCGKAEQCQLGRCVGAPDGGAPDATPTCTARVPITQSGALDVDLPIVALSGRVTRNGAALPAANRERGWLVFSDAQGGALRTKTLGTSGEGSYSTEIIAGTYDIYYDPGCNTPEQAHAAPCHDPRVLLKQGVSIAQPGALDLDLRIVSLTGQVMRNAAAMPPASRERGWLVFVDAQGNALRTKTLGTSGAATYSTEVVAGTYDVYYDPGCSTPEQAHAAPCHEPRVLVKQQVSITQSGALDVNLPIVSLSGRVTRNGAPMPAAGRERGYLVFVGSDTSALRTLPLGVSGEAKYSTQIVAGTYDLYYDPGCSTPEQAHIAPCHSPRVLVKQALSITQSGALDVDLPILSLSGRVTRNGAALPAASRERGYLVFVDKQGNALRTGSFGASGEATYATLIVRGTYDIYYDPGCSTPDAAHAAPCHSPRVLVKQGVSITQGGALDVDLSIVSLSGRVTRNAAALPPADRDRGWLVFARGDGSNLRTQSFGTSGEALYSTELIAGTYDVYYDPGCTSPDQAHVAPCHSPRVLVQRGIPITQSGALDVDLRIVSLAGQVLRNGAPLPPATRERGWLVFVDPQHDALRTHALGTSGGASYSTEIVAGNYDVYYDPGCSSPDQAHAAPCHEPRVLIMGCGPGAALP